MSDDLRPFGAESANLTGDERDLRALPVGNHVAEIVRVSRGATDNGSHIDLTVRNPSGELSDRIAYSTANSSAGLWRCRTPQASQCRPATTWMAMDACQTSSLDRWPGRRSAS